MMTEHEAVGPPIPESLIMGGRPLVDTFSCLPNVLCINPIVSAGDTIGAVQY